MEPSLNSVTSCSQACWRYFNCYGRWWAGSEDFFSVVMSLGGKHEFMSKNTSMKVSSLPITLQLCPAVFKSLGMAVFENGCI